MPAEPARRGLRGVLVVVLVAAAVTLGVYLLREGRLSREARLDEALQRVRTPVPPAPLPADAPPPPVLFPLPAFRLVSESGRPFGLAELRGKVWIGSFFFTSCPSICPRLTRRMQKLFEATRPHDARVHLVSISVDPATDTPARLLAYGRKYGIDPRRWTLLTGPLREVEQAVRAGFQQAMERQPTPVRGPLGEDLYHITHGARFVLVDGDGGLRGFYDSDAAGRQSLLRDLAPLLRSLP